MQIRSNIGHLADHLDTWNAGQFTNGSNWITTNEMKFRARPLGMNIGPNVLTEPYSGIDIGAVVQRANEDTSIRAWCLTGWRKVIEVDAIGHCYRISLWSNSFEEFSLRIAYQ